jgi:hypothetical protein
LKIQEKFQKKENRKNSRSYENAADVAGLLDTHIHDFSDTTIMNIDVNGENFPCPLDWNVGKAREEIRSAFQLGGGYLANNGSPLGPEAVIGDQNGNLTFLRGQSLAGK